MAENQISSKIWNIAGVLRDDGISNQDYLEQLTFLLFLKMVDESNKPPHNSNIPLPDGVSWSLLTSKTGAELADYYKQVLDKLSHTSGMMREIYQDALNKINNPSNLKRVIGLIDNENWSSMAQDVKGEVYESLLQKVAEDTKSGAGQYFTPRPLIEAIVECVAPMKGKTIADPACGSGGFLLAAHDYILGHNELNSDDNKFLRFNTFFGTELVRSTYRQCLMNLFLHNIGNIITDDPNYQPPIKQEDSLMNAPTQLYDCVLANPPFGSKSSMTVTNQGGGEDREDIDYNRQDFWTETKNKQFNFVMHIHSMLKVNGEAAVVVPDNVLFEGGAGEIVRKKLLDTCDLHTILRLPTGIFYKQGVQANVIFFKKREAREQPWTKQVWIYDFRTGNHFTLKKNPLKFGDLQEFIDCYKANDRTKTAQTFDEQNNPEGRFRVYSYDEIIGSDKTNLDIRWLKTEEDDDSTIEELMSGLQDEAATINESVQKLNELLKGTLL